MQVKMFYTAGDVSSLEKELNTWLSTRKISVNTIKQSYSCDNGTCYTLISVWFESQESVTGI
jgi:hypothetical protein